MSVSPNKIAECFQDCERKYFELHGKDLVRQANNLGVSSVVYAAQVFYLELPTEVVDYWLEDGK